MTFKLLVVVVHDDGVISCSLLKIYFLFFLEPVPKLDDLPGLAESSVLLIGGNKSELVRLALDERHDHVRQYKYYYETFTSGSASSASGSSTQTSMGHIDIFTICSAYCCEVQPHFP